MDFLIIFFYLLMITFSYASEKKPLQVPSLGHICYERCKKDLSAKDVNFDNILIPVINRLSKNNAEDLLNRIYQKEHPHILAMVNKYNPLLYSDTNNKDMSNICQFDVLSKKLYKSHQQNHTEKDYSWDKRYLKISSEGKIYDLSIGLSEIWFKSWKTKNITPTRDDKDEAIYFRYDTVLETGRKQEALYPGEPYYDKDGTNNLDNMPFLSRWCDNDYPSHCFDVFPNGTTIIAHRWGGILYNGEKTIEWFVTNNSICSVCCLPDNEHIVLGSYDGSISIINIQKKTEGPLIPPCKGSFTHYINKFAGKEKSAYIVKKFQVNPTHPISTICLTNNKESILFSLGNCLYSIDIKNVLNAKAAIDDEKQYLPFFKKNEVITHFTQVNELIVCILESKNDTIHFIDLKGEKKYHSVIHTSHINALCSYTVNQNISFITGDNAGTVIVWDITQKGVIKKLILNHNDPVYFVGVTPDNRYIIVQTIKAASEETKYHTDKNIFFYPTFDYLPTKIQKQSKKIEEINSLFTINDENPSALYQLLTKTYQKTFQRQKIKKFIDLKNKIQNRIISLLKREEFKKTVDSYEKLTSLLGIFNQNYFSRVKIDDPLLDPTRFNNQIEELLRNITIKVIEQELGSVNEI